VLAGGNRRSPVFDFLGPGGARGVRRLTQPSSLLQREVHDSNLRWHTRYDCVEAVRYTRQLSSCTRADLRCKSMPAQDYSELNARVKYGKHDLHLGLASAAARRTTPGGTVYHGSAQSAGSAEHTDWRFACAVRIAPNSRRPARTCFFPGAGDKQGQLRHHRLST
jgi:hypothetical protein